ncbi:hypothetical protein NH8B_0571 [Pseudogulbenkiania sp. NH8B]|uniref:DUF7696 family protein n=1 Tax=Pseudogulbenkiania sp. (strain NH8B) TaxID=748280 RepID=UPI000227957B|nr:hypothetical protein [Pseudogulbenkiania sp. NH8B]BAK75406.1 hypothetical protein NH8B_0571 [Pseudogulbenkiania sp. NH8B]
MTWCTAGLAGQVFDGPACYVEAWDVAFQREVRRIAGMETLRDRRAALKRIEESGGKAARKRMEAALARQWNQRMKR